MGCKVAAVESELFERLNYAASSEGIDKQVPLDQPFRSVCRILFTAIVNQIAVSSMHCVCS